ncbi:hypothetical protein C5167_040616 [Papaver somniferum]|uniref:Uncharacterized protein n=1 Tax=Papaver somniferum TaxID=3469 RepID=A0A4Y7IJR8_PAPSO|nr:hypothetical protein C5167_040616 [Papaver somniferum]
MALYWTVQIIEEKVKLSTLYRVACLLAGYQTIDALICIETTNLYETYFHVSLCFRPNFPSHLDMPPPPGTSGVPKPSPITTLDAQQAEAKCSSCKNHMR